MTARPAPTTGGLLAALAATSAADARDRLRRLLGGAR